MPKRTAIEEAEMPTADVTVTPAEPANHGNPGEEGEPTVQAELQKTYDLHIKLYEEMRPKLKDAAQLAYMLQNIPKPDLADLMELFIGWGMKILEQQWLNKLGYR